MSVISISQSARTQLSGAAAAANGIASATFVTLGTITHSSSGKVPLDTFVELSITPTTTTGNRQALLYAQFSLDGSNFGSGPVSGTDATNEANLILIGAIALNQSNTLQRKTFSIASVNGGVLPYATRIVLKNDSGATFATTGNDVYTQNYYGDNT